MIKYLIIFALIVVAWVWYQKKQAMDGRKHSWAVTRGLEPTGLNI